MASFVVMEPPGSVSPSERAVFVRDGFYVLAFLVPVLWFAVHRCWLAALAALAVAVGVPAAAGMLGYPEAAGGILLVSSFWFGLEAGNIRVAALRRRGFADAGVVEADRASDAEIRYLAGAIDDMPAATMTQPSQPWGTTGRPVQTAGGPALGLFGYPGRR